jgi:hypothetical protein
MRAKMSMAGRTLKIRPPQNLNPPNDVGKWGTNENAWAELRKKVPFWEWRKLVALTDDCSLIFNATQRLTSLQCSIDIRNQQRTSLELALKIENPGSFRQ